MVAGLRVVFTTNPASLMLYGYAVPPNGTRGSVTGNGGGVFGERAQE